MHGEDTGRAEFPYPEKVLRRLLAGEGADGVSDEREDAKETDS